MKGHNLAQFSCKRFCTGLLQKSLCSYLGCTVVLASGCVVKLYLWSRHEWNDIRTTGSARVCLSLQVSVGQFCLLSENETRAIIPCGVLMAPTYRHYYQYSSRMSTFFISPLIFLQGGPAWLGWKVGLHGQCGGKGSSLQNRWGGGWWGVAGFGTLVSSELSGSCNKVCDSSLNVLILFGYLDWNLQSLG